ARWRPAAAIGSARAVRIADAGAGAGDEAAVHRAAGRWRVRCACRALAAHRGQRPGHGLESDPRSHRLACGEGLAGGCADPRQLEGVSAAGQSSGGPGHPVLPSAAGDRGRYRSGPGGEESGGQPGFGTDAATPVATDQLAWGGSEGAGRAGRGATAGLTLPPSPPTPLPQGERGASGADPMGVSPCTLALYSSRSQSAIRPITQVSVSTCAGPPCPYRNLCNPCCRSDLLPMLPVCTAVTPLPSRERGRGIG